MTVEERHGTAFGECEPVLEIFYSKNIWLTVYDAVSGAFKDLDRLQLQLVAAIKVRLGIRTQEDADRFLAEEAVELRAKGILMRYECTSDWVPDSQGDDESRASESSSASQGTAGMVLYDAPLWLYEEHVDAILSNAGISYRALTRHVQPGAALHSSLETHGSQSPLPK